MNILVIEDDRRIASFLERGLAAEGYHVSVEQDGRDGLERLRADPFDLVILDRMLPYVDGMEVCRVIREERLPVMVLMLTAKDSLQDKIAGLKGGADDYLTKPFAFDELLARIVALRRRENGHDQPKLLRVGDITLDAGAHRVSKNGQQLNLTLREFELLRYLMSNADKVVSRQRLLSSVWDYGYDPGTKIVDVYVRYLRQKIDNPEAPSLIQTVRGVGYMMSAASSPAT
ncbi:response regulator transcription factor [Devosia sp.]|uniref:response regulator transcription factor n=1 Tax=Devosia sp. TaxID=1871048 RepID=UPI001AC640F7|nr:response regulator transcription factor [Devosia sp.]MBN9332355.1 response regulator transcription factor [Devosia sp.]